MPPFLVSIIDMIAAIVVAVFAMTATVAGQLPGIGPQRRAKHRANVSGVWRLLGAAGLSRFAVLAELFHDLLHLAASADRRWVVGSKHTLADCEDALVQRLGGGRLALVL